MPAPQSERRKKQESSCSPVFAFRLRRPASPFLAEIRQAEACGGLILALGAHARDDEHEDRDDIGDHLIELLNGEVHTRRQEDMQDIQSAEEERGKHADVRLPDREDDERDGEPATVAEGVVRPDAAGVVHDVVQSAEPGDHAADTGGDVLILVDVDAGGIGRLRVFADGAQVCSSRTVYLQTSNFEGSLWLSSRNLPQNRFPSHLCLLP